MAPTLKSPYSAAAAVAPAPNTEHPKYPAYSTKLTTSYPYIT